MLEVLKIFNLFDFQILRLQQYCRYRSKLIEQLLIQGKKPLVESLKSLNILLTTTSNFLLQLNQVQRIILLIL